MTNRQEAIHIAEQFGLFSTRLKKLQKMQLFLIYLQKLHILLILINGKFDNLLGIKEEIIMSMVSEKWMSFNKRYLNIIISE